LIKVTVITLGRLKEKYLSEAVNEYSKRLSRYCDLNIIEFEPIKLSDKPSEAEINSALEKEADMILKKTPQNCYTVALCVEGKELSSPELADKIKENERLQRRNMELNQQVRKLTDENKTLKNEPTYKIIEMKKTTCDH